MGSVSGGGVCLYSYPCKTALHLEHLAMYVDCPVLLLLWLLFHIVVVAFYL